MVAWWVVEELVDVVVGCTVLVVRLSVRCNRMVAEFLFCKYKFYDHAPPIVL